MGTLGPMTPSTGFVPEGFGKNATGGQGYTTYTVTSSAKTGSGTWEDIVNVQGHRSNCIIQFAVSTVNVYYGRNLGSNVTIDGLANGQNGVTFIQDMTDYCYVGFNDPCSNIIVRGIRFEGKETGVATLSDLVVFDGTNGQSISTVLVDRCTFVGAGDGALDITGNVTDVTIQRCLLYGTGDEADGGTSLIKYDTRARISLWGNVYSTNIERNPQIKGAINPFEFVNNIVAFNDLVGTDIRAGAPASDSPGLPTGNVRGCYFYTDNALSLDGGDVGYTPDVYVNGNTFAGGASNPGSPRGSEVSITSGYQITPLSASELEASVLDVVGSPNRTTRDNQIIEAVRAILP